MKLEFTLYMTHAVLWTSAKTQAILATLVWMQFKEPKTVVGVKEMALVTSGRFNPASDICLIGPDGTKMRDVVDLVHWIDLKGLRPL